LKKASDVEFAVYNLTGQQVDTLVKSYQQANMHEVIWNAGNPEAGLYFYRIQSGNFCAVKKCLLVK
jgi:hypothetical protein